MQIVESPTPHMLHMFPELKTGNLSAANLEWLASTTRKQHPYLSEAFAGFIDSNPRFHFTATAFSFAPDSKSSRDIFLQRSRKYGWTILENGDGLYVATNHIENITQGGLNPRSCVAAMPEGVHEELMKSHPRLFIDGIVRTVTKFGKHATPHKHEIFNRAHGCISDMQGAAVVIGEHVPTQPKGKIQRGAINKNNFLRPTTHYVPFGASSIDIIGVIPFNLEQSINCDGGPKEIDNASLAENILTQFDSGLIQFLREASDRGVFRNAESTDRAIAIFEAIRPPIPNDPFAS